MSFFHASQRDVLNQNLAEVQGQTNALFGFFPPRTSEMEQTLQNSIDHPSSLKPKFVSVTYDTNSGEHDRTHNTVKGIKDRTDLEAAPHLTCVDVTPNELRTITHDYWNNDIRHIVALRDDLPPGNDKPGMYASGLMTLLKGMTDFDISVVAYPRVYPEAKSTQADLLNPRHEVDAEADRAITQFFFDVESYPRFRDHCVSAGIDVEITPGILPISNFKQARKLADMTSVRIPAQMAQVFDSLDDDTEARKLVGMNIAMDMVKILSREEVKNLHFCTLNRAEISYAICHTLEVRPGL